MAHLKQFGGNVLGISAPREISHATVGAAVAPKARGASPEQRRGLFGEFAARHADLDHCFSALPLHGTALVGSSRGATGERVKHSQCFVDLLHYVYLLRQGASAWFTFNGRTLVAAQLGCLGAFAIRVVGAAQAFVGLRQSCVQFGATGHEVGSDFQMDRSHFEIGRLHKA